MEFYLNEKQLKQVDIWKKTLPPIKRKKNIFSTKRCYGDFDYIFTLTGIGLAVTVSRDDGKSIDVTDYDEW